MQAPHAALLRQMRMRRMRGQQLVQRRRSRIDVAALQIREHFA